MALEQLCFRLNVKGVLWVSRNGGREHALRPSMRAGDVWLPFAAWEHGCTTELRLAPPWG